VPRVTWLILTVCVPLTVWPPVMAARQVRRENRERASAGILAWYEREYPS
jgi:hypothetical protein